MDEIIKRPELAEIMGTADAAREKLIEKAREWRALRQPSIASRAQHRKTEAAEREVRFQLANAALLWLWHEERAALSASPSPRRQLTQEDVDMFDAALHASTTVVHPGELAASPSPTPTTVKGETL